jgi:hypothetical protein
MSVVKQMNSMETQNERPVAVCTIAGCGSYAPWLSASDDAAAETQATLQNMDTRRPKTKTALLLTVFSELDSAAEASVQKAELLSALRSCESLRSNFKLHAKQFPAYFEHVDADRNGKISREEFGTHGLLLLSAPGGAASLLTGEFSALILLILKFTKPPPKTLPTNARLWTPLPLEAQYRRVQAH